MTHQRIPRPEYLDRLQAFRDTDIVKVLTGLRGSGKSTLLEMLRNDLLAAGTDPSHLIVLDLESPQAMQLRSATALREYLADRLPEDGAQTYLFLDEIQLVDGWGEVVEFFRTAHGCDIYVAGSNANILAGESASLNRDNCLMIEVFPFSFAEFLSAYRQRFPFLSTSALFQKFLVLGGLPHLMQLGFDESRSQQYLRDLLDVVELRGMVDRTRIRDTDLLRRLLLSVLDNPATQISARSLTRYLKNEGRRVSLTTLLQYLRIGADALLYYPVPREDLRNQRLLSVADKYYVADQGLHTAILGNHVEDLQPVLENIVCLELLRRGYQITTGDNNGKEIDFVARRATEQLYIQVADHLAGREATAHEFGAFRGLEDSSPRIVVSPDELDMSRDGCQHWNVRDFLLAEQWQ